MKRGHNAAGKHVGFQTRDMDNGMEQRSPLFEVNGIDGKVRTRGFMFPSILLYNMKEFLPLPVSNIYDINP